MAKFNLAVTQEVEIEADLSRFTPGFIQAFKDAFYHVETPEEHVKNIAEAFVRGDVTHADDFLEGYGVLSEMGVTKLRRLGGSDVDIDSIT